MLGSAPAILTICPNGAQTVKNKNGAPHILPPTPAAALLVSGVVPGLHLTPSMWLALRQLLKAHDTARHLNLSRWEFAVEIDALEKAGCDHNDLRALICQGLVEHALELTTRPAKRRCLRRMPGLRLTPKSCFVLSDWGVAVSTQNQTLSANGFSTAPRACSPLPVWDAARRELRLEQVVLKRFRQPAKNQEAILAAFQEEDWPPRIDSPIPGGNDENALERLHDAVRRLNHQINGLVRFECDGTGEGVMWRISGAPKERPRSGA